MDLQLSGERLPQLADVVPQGIQHEFHRDLLQASSPESCQSHVLLDDPDSAFDLLDDNRARVLKSLDGLVAWSAAVQDQAASAQTSYYPDTDPSSTTWSAG